MTDMTSRGLANREIDIYMQWEVMSTVGLYYGDKV